MNYYDMPSTQLTNVMRPSPFAGPFKTMCKVYVHKLFFGLATLVPKVKHFTMESHRFLACFRLTFATYMRSTCMVSDGFKYIFCQFELLDAALSNLITLSILASISTQRDIWPYFI